MTEEETKTGFPAVMNPTDLSTALANSQVQETSTGGFSFLKMDFETGEWALGKEAEDVTGEEILVNTSTIQHGWILWSGGRPNKIMSAFNQALPMAMESIGADHPSEARSFQGAMMDNSEPLAFDSNSYGGRKGVDVLLGAIKAHAAEGSQHLYPKVKLTSESYANKKRGGKDTYNPVFELVAWCDQDGNEEPASAARVEDKTASEIRGENKTEETAAAPAEDPQPKRQRRSRRKAAA